MCGEARHRGLSVLFAGRDHSARGPGWTIGCKNIVGERARNLHSARRKWSEVTPAHDDALALGINVDEFFVRGVQRRSGFHSTVWITSGGDFKRTFPGMSAIPGNVNAHCLDH